MTIIERLEQIVNHKPPFGDFVGVPRDDLSALLECVRVQHDLIYYEYAVSKGTVGHLEDYEIKQRVAIEAEKKVGLKP